MSRLQRRAINSLEHVVFGLTGGSFVADKNEPRSDKPWVVRDVPEHVRRTVKSYAVSHGMTMADALELLILRGVAADITTARDPALGVLRDFPDKVLAAHVQRVLEEIERRNALSPKERALEEAERVRITKLAAADPNLADGDAHKLMAEYLHNIESEQ